MDSLLLSNAFNTKGEIILANKIKQQKDNNIKKAKMKQQQLKTRVSTRCNTTKLRST